MVDSRGPCVVARLCRLGKPFALCLKYWPPVVPQVDLNHRRVTAPICETASQIFRYASVHREKSLPVLVDLTGDRLRFARHGATGHFAARRMVAA